MSVNERVLTRLATIEVERQLLGTGRLIRAAGSPRGRQAARAAEK
jgi:hypothetical protein